MEKRKGKGTRYTANGSSGPQGAIGRGKTNVRAARKQRFERVIALYIKDPFGNKKPTGIVSGSPKTRAGESKGGILSQS